MTKNPKKTFIQLTRLFLSIRKDLFDCYGKMESIRKKRKIFNSQKST